MPWQYDVVGFLGGDFGLAMAARNSLHALRSSRRPVNEIPVVHRGGRGVERAFETMSPPGDRRITLFHVNPPDVPAFRGQWNGHIDPEAPSAFVPFWEMPLVPRSWEPLLGAVGAVLAPTVFIQEACSRAMPPERVLHYPQAVFLPADTPPCRERWGLPTSATVFVISFDVGSDIERKNPWAGIEAFLAAFPGAESVRLVIKMKPWPGVPEYRELANQVRARAGQDRRIVVIDEELSYPELLGVYASCDVMLSLHRSEGLGLHLMEAMSLGKVVVATNWSGNTDFMTSSNSVPVDFRIVPVAPRHPHYAAELGRPGQVWAEPDVVKAARALRELHRDRLLRAGLGRAAAVTMESRRRTMLAGHAFDRLEECLALQPAQPGPFQAAMRRTDRARRWARVQAAARAIARRVGLG
jgi:glycosyltransferase involved in cell wall biosynthesis